MNKEFYDYGTLVDFKGEEHHIVVCVVFRPFKQTVFKDGVEILQGVISIGVSICNPMDTFDVHLGEQIAYNKALKPNTPALYTNTKGIVTDNLLSTLADQEVEYVINNPNKFIKGYNDARARWEKRVATKTMLSNLSQEEKDMIALINKGVDVQKCVLLSNEKMDS